MALTLMPASNFSLASFWFASASSKYVCKPTWQYDFPTDWSGKTHSIQTKPSHVKPNQGHWMTSKFSLASFGCEAPFSSAENTAERLVGPSIDGRKEF